jgi:MYXO-CTERM domain-containing protein
MMRKKLMMAILMSSLALCASSRLQGQTGTGGTGSGTGAGGTGSTAYSDTGARDDDRDWGWLGLLGLAGLLGLRRREVHRDARSATAAPVR